MPRTLRTCAWLTCGTRNRQEAAGWWWEAGRRWPAGRSAHARRASPLTPPAPPEPCASLPSTHRQLLADPFLLAKFKSEVADKRSRANNFTRTLADVSRTLRDLGLHHTLQAREGGEHRDQGTADGVADAQRQPACPLTASHARFAGAC